jgi:Flp pilus assembly protein TadG
VYAKTLASNPAERSKVSRQLGQALLEVTLICTVLTAAMLGAAELGRLSYAAIVVSNAARAGLQYGAQSRVTAQDSAGMQQAALNDGQNVTTMTATATHYCSCSTGSTANCTSASCGTGRLIEYVQVNTSARVPMIFHCPGLPASITLNAQGVMRVVQ